MVSLMPDSLSSVENAVNGIDTPTVCPFDFANLNGPAPASVVLADFGCEPYEKLPRSYCLPISDCRPWLAVPDEVRWLHPDRSTCVTSLVGSYDPPRVLVPAPVLVASTTSAAAPEFSSLAATPAPNVQPQAATRTVTFPTEPSNSIVSKSKYIPNLDDPGLEIVPDKEKAFSQSSMLGNPEPSGKGLGSKDPPVISLPVLGLALKYIIVVGPSTFSAGENAASFERQDSTVASNGMVDGDARIAFSVFQILGAANGDEKSEKTFPSTEAPPGPGPKEIFANQITPSVVISVEQTMTPGDLLTDSGKALSVPSIKPEPNNAMPVITVGSSYYQADSAGNYIIYGRTVTPGETLTVSGKAISALSIGPVPDNALPVITIGASTYKANSGGNYIINGKTLTPGRELAISQNIIPTLLLSGSTVPLPIIIIGSKTYTANLADQTQAATSVDGAAASKAMMSNMARANPLPNLPADSHSAL